MLLSFLCAFCSINVSSAGNNTLWTFDVTEPMSLCLNTTFIPLYLVLYAVPPDTQILFYRQKVVSAPSVLDFTASAQDLSFALRSTAVNSSFTVEAQTPGVYKLGVIEKSVCDDGILIAAAPSARYVFGTSEAPPFDLAPGMNKCLLVVNEAYTNVDLEMDVIRDADFLYFYSDSPYPIKYTGSKNATFTKDRPASPALFRIEVSQDPASPRTVAFDIASRDEPRLRETYLGRFDVVRPTVIPAPNTTTIKNWGVGTPHLISLVSVLTLCLAWLVGACIRYEWISAFRCAPRSDEQTDQPLPPSSFVFQREK